MRLSGRRPSRRVGRGADMIVEMATKPTAIRKIAVPITWTCGGRLLRIVPQIQSGNVFTRPDVKLVMTKSSIERLKREQRRGDDARAG